MLGFLLGLTVRGCLIVPTAHIDTTRTGGAASFLRQAPRRNGAVTASQGRMGLCHRLRTAVAEAVLGVDGPHGPFKLVPFYDDRDGQLA